MLKFLEMLGVDELPLTHSTNSVVYRSREQNRSSIGRLFRVLERETAGLQPAPEPIRDPARRNMIRRVFHRALGYFPEVVSLAVGYLNFEHSYSKQKGKALAMSLLKADQLNLQLWNGYAKMERSAGNLREARRVYETALANYSKLPVTKQNEAILLFKSFAMMEYKAGSGMLKPPSVFFLHIS